MKGEYKIPGKWLDQKFWTVWNNTLSEEKRQWYSSYYGIQVSEQVWERAKNLFHIRHAKFETSTGHWPGNVAYNLYKSMGLQKEILDERQYSQII